MLDLKSAVEFARLQLKSKLGTDDLRFRLSSEEGPSPHHLAFQYWDQLYFVHLELTEAPLLGCASREEMISLSEAADATPVVLKLALEDGTWRAAENVMHLRCARTGNIIDPSVVPLNLNWSVRPNQMTPYDLLELAVQVVSTHILKNGGKIQTTCIGVARQPSITFIKENEQCYAFVDYSLYPDLTPKFRRGFLDSIGRLGLPLERCFWGPVGFANSKDSFDPSGSAALQITRRDKCFSRFEALRPMPQVNPEIRSSYTASDNEMLVSYVPNRHHDTKEYVGHIDFEDLNPFAQDTLIKQAVQLYGKKEFRRYREPSEFGVKKNQVSAIESAVANAISYLQYNGFVADDIDRNFYHQLRRFFSRSNFGVRLDEAIFELHQYPFSKRTLLPGALFRHPGAGEDEAAQNVEDSPERFAFRIGLDMKVRPAFPTGSDRSFDTAFFKELRWEPRSLAEGLDALLFALPIIGFPIREHLSPAFKTDALKAGKRQFESPVAYLLYLLLGKSQVLIPKLKRCAETWPGAYDTKGGFADLSKEFSAHDLNDAGYLLLDFLFDSASYLERRRQIASEAAMKFRIQALQSAFGYSAERFYCASLIRQWERSNQ